MKKLVKTIATMAIMVIMMMLSYLLGTTQAKTITEVQAVTKIKGIR